MEIIRDISAYNADSEMVISIGNFDGVHLGHAALVKRAVGIAKERGIKSGFVTFDPHPVRFFGADIKLLQTEDMKIRSFEELGADALFIIEFNAAFAKVDAEDFIRDYLLKKMRASVILVGYDYHFGKNRKGSFDFLKKMGEKEGFTALRVAKVQVGGVTASSTNIRNFLVKGDPESAARLLGRNYAIGGEVIHGDGIAAGIGFPTANLSVRNEMVPMNGIYACLVHIDDEVYKGALYIGDRPTVDGTSRRVEVNVFDFEGDLYGKYIETELVSFIRGDRKFASIGALATQIKKDCENIRVFFENKE